MKKLFTYKLFEGKAKIFKSNLNIGNCKFKDLNIDQEHYDHMYGGFEEYLKILTNLYNNGGIVYRALYMLDGKEIDKKKLGVHYTISEENLINIDVSLSQLAYDIIEEKEPNFDRWKDTVYTYHMHVEIPPNNIDVKSSINHYNYHEKEINLLDNKKGKIIAIYRYKYDYDNVETLWKTKEKIL